MGHGEKLPEETEPEGAHLRDADSRDHPRRGQQAQAQGPARHTRLRHAEQEKRDGSRTRLRGEPQNRGASIALDPAGSLHDTQRRLLKKFGYIIRTKKSVKFNSDHLDKD